jgi:hypothetical protein
MLSADQQPLSMQSIKGVGHTKTLAIEGLAKSNA